MFCVTSTIILVLLIYVDNIIIIGNNPFFIQEITIELNLIFALIDLGNLSYFLGMELIRTNDSFHLSQQKYI